MKIVSIVGARPQFIKLGPLSSKIRKFSNEIIIHTGQHYDENMSKNIFKDLEIPKPDYNLNINGGLHGNQVGRMLISLEEIIGKVHPDLLIIFGDTNSTLAGALVAAKLNIKIIHIEAGLRSFNRTMPEEINRIISDNISNYLFAPTKASVKNLENEGLIESTYLTGDIMVDALKNNIKKAINSSEIIKQIGIQENYYLLTLHRPYNVDDPNKIKLILSRLNELNSPIIFPVHPRTKSIIDNYINQTLENIIVIDPVSYLDFLFLEKSSKKIITDSGGIQKEAYLLKKPCITIRTETEWLETIEEGWNQLVNPYDDDFIQKIELFNPVDSQNDVFGTNVAAKMCKIIKSLF